MITSKVTIKTLLSVASYATELLFANNFTPESVLFVASRTKPLSFVTSPLILPITLPVRSPLSLLLK